MSEKDAITSQPVPSANPSGPDPFWKDYGGLNWSNRDAPDDVWIACALTRPYTPTIKKVIEKFGMERVERVWLAVKEHPFDKDIQTAIIVTDRILAKIKAETNQPAENRGA